MTELTEVERLESQLTVYKAMLPINRDDLDTEIEQHSSIRMSIAECKVDAERHRDMCDRQKSRLFNTTCEHYRALQLQAHDDDAGPKPTKDSTEKAARSDDGYIAVCEQQIEASALYREWSELLLSWEDRSFRLTDAVKKYIHDKPPYRLLPEEDRA